MRQKGGQDDDIKERKDSDMETITEIEVHAGDLRREPRHLKGGGMNWMVEEWNRKRSDMEIST